MRSLTERSTMENLTFGRVYAQYRPYIFGILRRFCSKDSIDDVSQEAFAEIFRSLKGCLYPQLLRYWLARITVRTAMRHRHKATRRVYSQQLVGDVSLDNMTDPLTSAAEENIVFRDMFDKAFSELEPLNREIAHRIFVCGYSSQDVGRELGISDSTVRGRVMQIREILSCAGISRQECEE